MVFPNSVRTNAKVSSALSQCSWNALAEKECSEALKRSFSAEGRHRESLINWVCLLTAPAIRSTLESIFVSIFIPSAVAATTLWEAEEHVEKNKKQFGKKRQVEKQADQKKLGQLKSPWF